jgi:methionyl-tRNA formyltransferase
VKLVFMGTAPFAVPCFRILREQGYTLQAVVTQPDRPAGRGQGTRESAVKRAALGLGMPILQPEKASQPEFVDALRTLAPDVIVVVAYGQILRPAVLDIPPLGCINVHGSLLPRLRGAAPIQWAVIRGEPETGVTTMIMDPGMDTGDIILQAAEPIVPDDTAGSFAERLAPRGAELLAETLDLLRRGRAPRRPQDAAQATYAPLLKREDGFIDWSQPAVAIRNRIHGCNPTPGALAFRDGRPVKLWRARVVEEGAGTSDLEPGSVVRIDAGGPLVITGDGLIQLLEVQPESRPRMTGDEYSRGYRLLPEQQFTPPPDGQPGGPVS